MAPDLSITGIDLDHVGALFAAVGKVLVKTRDGKPIELTLDTEGWEQARTAWRATHPEPKPPYTDQIVLSGSLEAKALELQGHSGPMSIRRYDFLDAAYKAAHRQWQIDEYYAITAHCLKLPLKRGGREITNIAERVAALKSLGMSELAVDQITDEIVELSKLAKARAVGFGGAPSEPPAS